VHHICRESGARREWCGACTLWVHRAAATPSVTPSGQTPRRCTRRTARRRPGRRGATRAPARSGDTAASISGARSSGEARSSGSSGAAEPPVTHLLASHPPGGPTYARSVVNAPRMRAAFAMRFFAEGGGQRPPPRAKEFQRRTPNQRGAFDRQRSIDHGSTDGYVLATSYSPAVPTPLTKDDELHIAPYCGPWRLACALCACGWHGITFVIDMQGVTILR
jgi:hypothetical protein